jgi:hypothetical protein
MGAETIGYLVVGPVNFDDKVEEAIAHVVKESNVAQALINLIKHIPEENLDDDLVTNICAISLVFMNLYECYGDISDTIDELESYIFSEEEAKKVVDDFVNFWKNGARDTTCRLNPLDSNYLIVFSGEQTWGGEPDGYGYTKLKQMFTLGLDEVFGIS